MKSGRKYSRTERGVASIFVVFTLMILLALISIGFSRLMNREVRQSLDRQLSLAAYYSAESGVNDARNYLADGGQDVAGCQVPNGAHSDDFVAGGDISGDGLFKYSCVIVNPTPKELQFTINAGESKVVMLTGNTLKKLSNLYFGWQNASPYNDTPRALTSSLGQLPQQGALGQDNTGLLRVGVYPMVDRCNDVDTHGNRFTRYSTAADSTNATIECASRNYFMYPNDGSASAPDCGYSNLSASRGCVRYDDAYNDGGIVPGNCISPSIKPNTDFSNQATPAFCNSEITNLLPVKNGAKFADSYYLRLTAVYKPLKVFIQATDNSSPTPKTLKISDAEAVIDITGTGNDILRRVQAIAPLQDNVPQLNFGLQSMESVCKLFRNDVVAPGQYGNPHLDSAAALYNSDNNCAFPTGNNVIDTGGITGVQNYPPPTVSLSASPNPLGPGDSSTLSWNSTTADFCSASGGPWNGSNLEPSGSTPVGPINSDTTFSISCTGPGGTTPASVTIRTVCNDPSANNYGGPPPCDYTPPPPPPPDCDDHGGDAYTTGAASWHADITGNNPCGVGIVQCVWIDISGVFRTYVYGDPQSLDDSDPAVIYGTFLGCQDIQGNWY